MREDVRQVGVWVGVRVGLWVGVRVGMNASVHEGGRAGHEHNEEPLNLSTHLNLVLRYGQNRCHMPNKLFLSFRSRPLFICFLLIFRDSITLHGVILLIISKLQYLPNAHTLS